MRRLILSGLVLCGAEQAVFAQYPNCQVPQPNCQVPQYCYPPRHVPQPGPESAPEEEGAFVAGPESAETAGESNSVGLRFGTLRIPEVTIPFPTLQLPSFVRFRHDAERITGPTHMPYVPSQVPQYTLRPQPAQESAPETPPAPESAPDDQPPYYYPPNYCAPCVPGACTSNDADRRVQQLQQQIAQLNAAVLQLAAMQANAPHADPAGTPSGPYQAQPAGNAANAAAAPAVTPEDLARLEAQFTRELQARQAEYQAAFEQKCQELEAMESQLSETQAEYQQVLETRSNQVREQRNERLRRRMLEQTDDPADEGVEYTESPRPAWADGEPFAAPNLSQPHAPAQPAAQPSSGGAPVRSEAAPAVITQTSDSSNSPRASQATTASIRIPPEKPGLLNKLFRRER